MPSANAAGESVGEAGELTRRRIYLARGCMSAPVAKKMKPLGFVMARYWTRKVALKVAYLGGAYTGNTMSAVDADNTVEAKLSAAMVRVKLIESFEASGWSRCGRTDKGVSAWANVCTMTVRSQLRGRGATDCRDPGLAPPAEPDAERAEKDCFDEIDYVKVLNRILPADIRVISWSPVAADFDARFNARARTYRYYFLHDGLDVDAMRRASAYLVGTHDFRNLCQIDVSNRQSWVRTFHSASVEVAPGQLDGVLVATFCASSFLWHQIRFIMAILFHVGRRLEQPELVAALLRVDEVTAKPQFTMASDVPLVLQQCDFDDGALQWRGQDDDCNAFSLYSNLHSLYEDTMLRAAMLRDMVAATHQPHFEERRRSQALLSTRKYVPILERERQLPASVKIERLDQRKKREEAEAAAAAGAALHEGQD